MTPAGRRSGKTEIAKRRAVKRLLLPRNHAAMVFAAAPTREQAKRIYWSDIKAMIPPNFIIKAFETDLIIRLVTLSEFHVMGMDRPERVEGSPWDHGIMDEYGNMRETAWPNNVRPALSDRLGSCDFIGVPEGRNHYYDMAERAKVDTDDWAYHHWRSDEILPPSEILAAKRDLDELTYEQEYGGAFVTFSGRVYYAFLSDNYSTFIYNPQLPVHLCFDFNVDPGTASIVQEIGDESHVVSEVYIARNSNTEKVCKQLLDFLATHNASTFLYGDAAGGARHTSQTQGSDWDIVNKLLRPLSPTQRTHAQNPSERARINAMNSRIRSSSGQRRFFVNPQTAPFTARDFEGVEYNKVGEIDKRKNRSLTHLSDGLGYYTEYRWPITEGRVQVGKVVGLY